MLIYLAGCMSYYYENSESQKAEHWRNIAKERLKDIGISTYELVYAHALEKPILAFGGTTIYGHPHLKHIIRNCFVSLSEVLEFLDTVYCQ